jgi:hypothetical protein
MRFNRLHLYGAWRRTPRIEPAPVTVTPTAIEEVEVPIAPIDPDTEESEESDG